MDRMSYPNYQQTQHPKVVQYEMNVPSYSNCQQPQHPKAKADEIPNPAGNMKISRKVFPCTDCTTAFNTILCAEL